MKVKTRKVEHIRKLPYRLAVKFFKTWYMVCYPWPADGQYLESLGLTSRFWPPAQQRNGEDMMTLFSSANGGRYVSPVVLYVGETYELVRHKTFAHAVLIPRPPISQGLVVVKEGEAVSYYWVTTEEWGQVALNKNQAWISSPTIEWFSTQKRFLCNQKNVSRVAKHYRSNIDPSVEGLLHRVQLGSVMYNVCLGQPVTKLLANPDYREKSEPPNSVHPKFKPTENVQITSALATQTRKPQSTWAPYVLFPSTALVNELPP